VQMTDFISKMKPRLPAESTGESMTLLARQIVRLLSLESCCGRPKMINLVLEGLRERKSDDQRRSQDNKFSEANKSGDGNGSLPSRGSDSRKCFASNTSKR